MVIIVVLLLATFIHTTTAAAGVSDGDGSSVQVPPSCLSYNGIPNPNPDPDPVSPNFYTIRFETDVNIGTGTVTTGSFLMNGKPYLLLPPFPLPDYNAITCLLTQLLTYLIYRV